MRHRKAGKKLGRTSSHRKAMLRNMATSLFKHEQVVTTETKAKELRPVAEKLITLAKKGDLHARRQALAFIKDKFTAHKLFSEIKDRYLDRQGGYLRIVKKGIRKGDAAPISVVQLLEIDLEKKKKKKEKAGTASESKTSQGKKTDEVKDAVKKDSKDTSGIIDEKANDGVTESKEKEETV